MYQGASDVTVPGCGKRLVDAGFDWALDQARGLGVRLALTTHRPSTPAVSHPGGKSMNSRSLARRPVITLAGAVAALVTVIVLAMSGAGASRAATHGARTALVPVPTARAVAFHDQMRALWEAHGSWTHMVIISFVGNLPNLKAEEAVLLRNQVDIGNAVKPYYGRAAGNKLTRLLREHIRGAVGVLVAAKSGDKTKLTSAERAWFANGRRIADFLHAADPRFLSRTAARRMMKVHLNQVIEQAVDELKGDYRADARAFAPYIRHLLDMADMISGGIIRQFPGRFL
jgi:hypothetical protein